MSSLARRYDAIRKITGYCSTSTDTDAVLQRVLSTAQAVMPCTLLEIRLPINGKQLRIVRPDGITILKQISAADDNSTTTIPISSYGNLVCIGGKPTVDDKAFLEAAAQSLTLLLTPKPQISPDYGKRVEEISAIYEISQAFDNVQIDDLLKLITEKAAQVMDAQACSLMLKNPQRDELAIKASYGLPKQVIGQAHVLFGEGVAGRVALTGKPMLLANLEKDPRFHDSGVIPRPEIVSSICVPLKDEEGHVQGVLSIHRKSPATVFTERDVELFSVFASQASTAISNARLYSTLQERLQELSTLYDASRELSDAYSVEDASQALVRVAVGMTGGISAMLVLLDASQGGKLEASSGISETMRKAVAAAIDSGASTWLRGLRGSLSFSLDLKRRWPTSMRRLLDAMRGNFIWMNMIPLMAEDKVLGVLILGDSGEKLPEQRRIRLLSIAASQAAVIIKNASRYEAQMGRKVLELSALYQLSERISTAGSLAEALDSILDIVLDIVWYDDAFISTVDYERNIMTVQSCHSKSSKRLLGTELSFDEDSLSYWAIHERKALLSPDISRDPRFHSLSAQVRGRRIRSLMAIPLIVHDEVVGVLNIHAHAPNLYTEENVRTLSVIASQAASLYKELEALSALSSYTDNVLRSIAAGVFTLNRDGRILTWNKAAEDIIGFKAGDTVGRVLSDVLGDMGIREVDKHRILASVEMVMKTGEKYLGYKQEYRSNNRSSMYLNVNMAQLRDHTGETLGLVVIAEDVTKEVRMENDMRKISELAHIGQLAASVAHEIRNPLSSIKGAAQYLHNEYWDHTSLCEFLDIIVDEVNVMNKITTDFLDFARPSKFNLQEIDVNDVIFRTVQFLQLDISKCNAEVVQNLSYDIPRIMADDRLLDQVLRNLVLNALQAMPAGGTICIATEPDDLGVKVTVGDTGTGIPEDQLSNIFVPFFTTKTRGTGLGLSIVLKIIENHGGRISVKSEIGVGTAFELSLPICSDTARTAIIQAEDASLQGDIDLMRRANSGEHDSSIPV